MEIDAKEVHVSNVSNVSNVCNMCGKTFSNKSNLMKHVRCIHQRSTLFATETDVSELECTAQECSYRTKYPQELKKHTQKCILLALQIDRTEQQSKHAFEVQELHKTIATLQAQNTLLQSELEKTQKMLQSLTEQAINRPTTVTHNIDNKNIKITNYLSDYSAYQTQTDPQRVREMLDLHLENYFFDGQAGLAKFVVEHIIRLEDGKMILCCTDPVRKRFRFVDANEHVAEDMRAKMLCSKLSVPVREMCNNVFQRIIDKLTREQKVKISSGAGAFDLDFLEKKIGLAHERFIEIRAFEGDENSDFLNELATLLRNPFLCQE